MYVNIPVAQKGALPIRSIDANENVINLYKTRICVHYSQDIMFLTIHLLSFISLLNGLCILGKNFYLATTWILKHVCIVSAFSVM